MGDRDELRAVAEEALVLVEQQLSAVVHRDHPEHGTRPRHQLLPGHDVGVVLEVGDDDLIALVDVLSAPAPGDEVDALGGARTKTMSSDEPAPTNRATVARALS